MGPVLIHFTLNIPLATISPVARSAYSENTIVDRMAFGYHDTP